MAPIIKVFYFLSIAFFLGNIFFAYYQFPDFVPVSFSDNLDMKEYEPKGTLFYMGGGAFLFFNFLIAILKLLFNQFPFGVFPLPNKQFWLENKESLVRIHQEWLSSFATIFNLLLGYIFMALFMVTVAEYGTFSSYIPLTYVFIGLLSSWWLILVGRLLVKKEQL